MSGGNFLELPMHAGGLVVKDLHPIHADIACVGVGVLSDYTGQGDKAAAIIGPALLNG